MTSGFDAVIARSFDAEAALVASCLQSPPVLEHALDAGVQADHLVSGRLRLIWDALSTVHAETGGAGVRTTVEQLRQTGKLAEAGGEAELDALTARGVSLGEVRGLARQVLDYARWRHRHRAALELAAACETMDPAAFEQADERLAAANTASAPTRTLSPPDVGVALAHAMNGGRVERFPWPLDRLNKLTSGGARRGHVTFVGGPTSHGKSVFVDQALDTMGAGGARIGLYINEMTAEERAERIAARRGKVRLSAIQAATAGDQRLDDEDAGAILKAMRDQPIALIECSGWSARDICRHARRQAFDVVCLDIIQRLPYRTQSRLRDLEEASNEFDRLAKQAPGRHVIIVGHLNRERSKQSGLIPVPSLSDVRDCAQLANDADNVVFVWREQDNETFEPIDDGLVRLAKCRGGQLGGVAVQFDGEYQTFIPVPPNTLRSVA